MATLGFLKTQTSVSPRAASKLKLYGFSRVPALIAPLPFSTSSRILDTFGGLIFAILGLFLLLFLFPFDFTYIADALPSFLRFLVKWISNDIARVIMVILIILHLAAAIYSPFAYKFIDKKLFNHKKISV